MNLCMYYNKAKVNVIGSNTYFVIKISFVTLHCGTQLMFWNAFEFVLSRKERNYAQQYSFSRTMSDK